MADTAQVVEFTKAKLTGEVGSAGLKSWSGIVDEEFLIELRGERGMRAFREMEANDPTVGAILSAIGLLLRAVTWQSEPNPDAPEAEGEAEAEFAMSLFDDMSHPFEDFLSELLSMLVYGWAYHEIVLKRRVGPLENDPAKRSKFTDGRIGIRKMPIRAQDTLERWDIQSDGGIAGMWQQDLVVGSSPVFIPIERALLFRTTSRRNNPQGRSILRNSYRPHYFLKRVQENEGVGIERELAGFPVISIPAEIFTDPLKSAQKALFTRMARDIRLNSQAGAVISSDPWLDQEGKTTSHRKVSIELLKTGGPRAIDTVAVKTGYQRDIARSVLADFIMLGTDKGAFNLAEAKHSLFYKSCEVLLWQIAAVLNRFLLPRIWDYNGLDRGLLPSMRPGRIAPVDLEQVSTLLKALTDAGDMVFPDEDLANFIRDEADLPPKSEDTVALQGERLAQEQEAAAAALRAMQQQQNEPQKPANKPEGKTPPKEEAA